MNPLKLFEPIKIGKLEIKNRISMAPMGLGLNTHDGGFSNRAIEHYIERAKGGVGLIVTGKFMVSNDIEDTVQYFGGCMTLCPPHFITTAGELTERVHAYGTKIFVMASPGMGRNGWPMAGCTKPVAPSPVPNYFRPEIICRELATEEVDAIVKKFGEAARIAVQAGFDGIEVDGHSGYLLDQFLISTFNKRTDKYGGDLKGRATLPLEILKEIKNAAGDDFPVTYRFTLKSYMKDLNQGALPGEDFKEFGRDIEEALELGKILEEAGYDGFDCDAGCYDAFYWAHPPSYQKHGFLLPLTERLKKVVKVPVIAAGKMGIPDLAERTLVEGKADMIALGRSLLADPFWPAKVRNGEIEKIRPCIDCHDGCDWRMQLLKPASCAVNPACCREKEYGIEPARIIKRIIVIGGGVAGMEAARVAALRGHTVTLYEKSNELGGHLIEAAIPDFKEDHRRLLAWYKRELVELNVRTSFGEEVNCATVEAQRPDVVVIATGSKPTTIDVPGINGDQVTTATELLLRRKAAGDSIAVIGGGLVGCETALWLAQQGKSVTIIEALNELMSAGQSVPIMSRTMLIDLLKFHKVNVITDTTLSEIKDNDVILKNKSGSESLLKVDTIVLALGLNSNQELYHSLASRFPDLYLIGDAREAINIMHAIWDAYEVARNL